MNSDLRSRERASAVRSDQGSLSSFRAPLPSWLSTRWQYLKISLLAILILVLPFAVIDTHRLSTALLAVVLGIGVTWLLSRAAASGTVPRSTLILLVSSLPLILAYIVSSFLTASLQGIENSVQLVLAVGFLAGMCLIVWKLPSMSALLLAAFLFLSVHAGLWLISGAPRHFGGPVLHPNALGFASLALGFVPLMLWRSRRYNSLIRVLAFPTIILSGLLLFVSSSRASWLAAAVSLVVYVVWPVLSRNRPLFWTALLLTVFGALAGTYLYLVAPQYEWGTTLDQLLMDISGRTLFSGRQRFWSELATAVKDRPLFGYGAGTIASDFTGFPWSAHNLYFQVMLELGLIGLAGLLIFLSGVWSGFWRHRHNHIARLAAAFMLGVLIHQVFEVTLIQNNLATGFLAWLVIAIGLSSERNSLARRA